MIQLKHMVLFIVISLLASCVSNQKWELHNYDNTYYDENDKPYKESTTFIFNKETGETKILSWDEDGNNYWEKIPDQKLIAH